MRGHDGWRIDTGRPADTDRRADTAWRDDTGRHDGTGWRLGSLLLAWLTGTALQLQQRSLDSPSAYAVAVVAGAVGIVLAWRWRRAFIAGLLGVALLAAGVAGGRATLRLADALPTELEGQDVVLRGTIAGLPQHGATGVRFRFAVEQAHLRGRPVRVPALLALGWYRAGHEDAVDAQPRREFRAGQRWTLTARLRRPHGNLNPHGFDYELLLFEQGVRATGYVRDAPMTPLDAAGGHPVERLRQAVRDAVLAHVPDRRAAGVLAALAVGDQGAIARADWELYTRAGVAHLMSISGLHVTMFAWLAGTLIGLVWRRSPRAMTRLPAPQAARWGGLVAATAYAVVSGWGVPAQRTVWMLATVTLLQTLGVRWPWALVLAAAAVVVAAIDPWALLQPGFWLSFAAVGLLTASAALPGAPAVDDGSGTAPTREDGVAAAPTAWWRRLAMVARQGLRTQAIATLGLAPLTLVFFQQLSLVGFAANLVAIPLVTLVVTPLALVGTLLAPAWTLAAVSVAGLNGLLERLAATPAAVWTVPAAPWWAQLAGLVGGALLVLPLPWRLRLLGIGLALPLLAPPRDPPADGSFDVLAADVGQGTAVLVRTRRHALLFDAGPQYGPDSDAGQRVLVPLLRALGVTRLDRLVLSHRDADHVGGAAAVLAAVPVASVSSSIEDAHPLRSALPRHERCAAGQSWRWDGVEFQVLRPVSSDYGRPLKANALSCVLRVVGEHGSLLLGGDIEAAQEAALLASAGTAADSASALASDVLIAPHHGSTTSSTPAFLDAVAPSTAVFQAGYRNRFAHPAPAVLARYRERGIAIAATPACGAWRWQARAGAAGERQRGAGRCERETARRYWHHVDDRGGSDDGAAAARR